MVKESRYYEVLQVRPEAELDIIKRSYRKLAKQFHPDKVQGTPEEKEAASEKFVQIQQV